MPQKPIVSSFLPNRKSGRDPNSEGAQRLNLLPVDSVEVADREMARFIMALRAKGIRNTALMSAFERTPRREFFDEDYAPFAYHDIALPLPSGQQSTSPHLVAQILAAADITLQSRVLEIGTGSGYQTALIARIAANVKSIDRSRRVLTQALHSVEKQQLGNVELWFGDGTNDEFLPDGPFDHVLINGAVSDVPTAVLKRVAREGVIIAPVGTGAAQALTRIEMNGNLMNCIKVLDARFAPLATGVSAAL